LRGEILLKKNRKGCVFIGALAIMAIFAIVLIAAYDPSVKETALDFLQAVRQTILDFLHAVFG
jgi:hypothetical protein